MVVFYGFVGIIVVAGILSSFSKPFKRFISYWIQVKVGRWVVNTSLGEIFFILSCIGMASWWFWWWFSGYGRIAQITDTLERLARVFGHI